MSLIVICKSEFHYFVFFFHNKFSIIFIFFYHLREVWALKHGSRQGGPSTSGSTRSRPGRYTRYRGTLVGGDDNDDDIYIMMQCLSVCHEK